MQAPPQPPNVEKVEVGPGVSVRVTCEPPGKVAEQVVGQLMPAGELTTVPVTVPLAMTLALRSTLLTHGLAIAFFLVSASFVWRSFYKMRIVRTTTSSTPEAEPAKEVASVGR